MSTELFDIINIFNAATCCFFIPVTLYFGYKYYKARNHVALEQRYASITLFEVICTCWILLLIMMFSIYLLIVYAHYKYAWNKSPYNYFGDGIVVIIDISLTVLTGCWILRFWMIRFAMKHEIAISNDQWMYIIHPQSIQLTNHKWYLDKINTFGNLRWMICHFVVPWVILWSVWWIFDWSIYLFPKNINHKLRYFDDLFWLLFYWTPCILLIILYCKFPKFKDHFFISAELKRLIILYIFEAILISCLPILNVANVKPLKIEDTIIVLMQFTMISVCGTLMSLTSTWWVMKKLKSIIVPYDEDLDNLPPMTMDGSMTFPLICKKAKNKYDAMREIQLKQILNNNEYFHVYIDHMSKELSTKYLLAFIEIVQLQKYIMEQNIDNIEAKFDNSLFQFITFYDSIPQSLIVSDDDHNHDEEKYEQPLLIDIKLKSNQLFKKYIDYGSEYEVLLTRHTRNKVIDIMSHIDWIEDDEYNINTILELLDDVTNELFILLLDAFSRFQTTLQYINLQLPRVF
eukprot:307181_1